MIFPELIGHDGVRRILARMLATGRIPHAMLFHGPEGVGKGTLARAFAASLLCETPRDGAMCGSCSACRRVAHGNHPDLMAVSRLPKAKKGRDDADDDADDPEDDQPAAASGDLRRWILVSQIRDVAEHAVFGPREGRSRVFVIDPADHMNAEAQNALLKTLEEPPERTVLLLVATRPHALLPTIRSRCVQIGFSSLAPDALAGELERRGMGREEARSRAALAEGRPGRAIGLDLTGRIARRDGILAALVELATSPAAVAQLPGWAADLVGDDDADFLEALDLAAVLLRDAALAATGHGPIFHADAARGVTRLGDALGAERAAELVALADRLRGDLRLNLNKSLVAETLLAAVAGAPAPLFA